MTKRELSALADQSPRGGKISKYKYQYENMQIVWIVFQKNGMMIAIARKPAAKIQLKEFALCFIAILRLQYPHETFRSEEHDKEKNDHREDGGGCGWNKLPAHRFNNSDDDASQ